MSRCEYGRREVDAVRVFLGYTRTQVDAVGSSPALQSSANSSRCATRTTTQKMPTATTYSGGSVVARMLARRLERRLELRGALNDVPEALVLEITRGRS